MKLSYFHYYFKERRKRHAPRVRHDIRPMLDAYLAFPDNDWKSQLKTEDGESLLLMRSSTRNVYMIIGTRNDDLVKAINTRTMTCEDLKQRLSQDEQTGFAGYFCLGDTTMGIASSLRGPKSAAVGRLVNHLTQCLGAERWKCEIMPIGTSVSLEEAKELSFVSRACVRVGMHTNLARRIVRFLAMDEDDVSSVEVVVRAKKSGNLHDSMQGMADRLAGTDLEKLILRARAMLDDEISDFYVSAQGNLSEVIPSGTEQQITNTIASRFHQNNLIAQRLEDIFASAVYDQPEVQDLSRLGDPSHWATALLV